MTLIKSSKLRKMQGGRSRVNPFTADIDPNINSVSYGKLGSIWRKSGLMSNAFLNVRFANIVEIGRDL